MQRHHCEDRLRLQGWNPYQQQSLLHAPSIQYHREPN
ncbi:Uncharacterised protein [Vibrio cholerae]|nr:Uncharacterised protein [Vibrio cholerae]